VAYDGASGTLVCAWKEARTSAVQLASRAMNRGSSVTWVLSMVLFFTRFQLPLLLSQGDHFSGKPGNVREFETCQGNVRDNVNSQGNVREKILSGKVSQNCSLVR